MPKITRTVGVEEELLLVDPETGVPTAVIEPILLQHEKDAEVLQKGEAPTQIQLESEVKQEQIEVVSPPCETSHEIYSAITTGRSKADAAAKEYGVRAVALGTSVIAVNSKLASNPRFEAMKAQFGVTLREQLTCGFHVHVSVSSEEEGVQVLDRIRPWLPILLALSTNSPMWSGKDTGFHSYRYQAWLRWPTAGAYPIFGSVDEYHEHVDSLISTGVLLDSGMVYFDARLAARYPTVEIRIADVCMKAEHATAIAALVRALVEVTADEWRDGYPARDVPTALLKLASWSASRFGVSESLVCPVTDEQVSAHEAVELLLKYTEKALTDYGDLSRVREAITDIFENGSGAALQRKVLQATGDPLEVVKEAIKISNQNLIKKA